MATKNAINSSIPIEVSKGGTAATTLTDHGVLVGSGTGAVNALAVGTTGELLVGVTGADPAFGVSANGNFTFTSSTSGSTRSVTVSHTDNTSTSSHALVNIKTGGSGGGDPYVYFDVGATDYAIGIDNTDSDSFKISDSSIGSIDFMRINASSGEINFPKQPAFLAYLGTTVSNATGDGTVFTLGTTTALTEVYDQNLDFNTNGTFTAPITGRYMFSAAIRVDDISPDHTLGLIQFVTSNGSYTPVLAGYGAIATSASEVTFNCTIQCDMDQSDTTVVRIGVYNDTKVVDIISSDRDTFFSGHLMC
jgi:hypothetical protein